MQVEIITFPETKVAVIEHHGSPEREHETVRKLIAWKIENRLLDPTKFRSFGLHYTDPLTTPPAEYRVDFCLSIEDDIAPNHVGIRNGTIPAMRCARAQDTGSRTNNQAAKYLHHVWLPHSGETLGDFPMIFHYVNVDPNVAAKDMITDVYLPLRFWFST